MKKALGLFSFLAVLAAFAFHPGNACQSPNTTALSVGDIAPDFQLKNVDGSTVSLAGITNPDGSTPNGYIVTFTCNTCPFAVMYEDRLIALHEKYAPKGWPVVAINPNDPAAMAGDSFDKMKERAEEKSFPFVYLFDEGQGVYPQYGATKTPHVFLLNNEREVKYIGAIDNNPQDAGAATAHYVEDAITAIEAGNDPDPDYTKAIGCTIKVKR